MSAERPLGPFARTMIYAVIVGIGMGVVVDHPTPWVSIPTGWVFLWTAMWLGVSYRSEDRRSGVQR